MDIPNLKEESIGDQGSPLVPYYTLEEYEEILTIFDGSGRISVKNIVRGYNAGRNNDEKALIIEATLKNFFHEAVRGVLYCPYEDLPLIINDRGHDTASSLLMWRLKKGR
jgi:hypothetical protein